MKLSFAGVFVAILALLASLAIHRAANDPGSHFLRAAPRAEWIRDGDPFFLMAESDVLTRTYRTRFTVPEPPVASATIELRTTGPAVVRVDGRLVAELPAPSDWNEPRQVELAPLAAGERELEITVANAGAGALAASLASLGVATGPHWEARARDSVWRGAALASEPVPPELAAAMRGFERPAWLWLAGAGVFALAFAALASRQHRALRCSASQLRWLVLGVWALVAVNDFFALPTWMGMDYDGHLAYVKFIVERRALPLATDGWEMFQAPLYYAICAGITALFGEWNGLVVRLFRLVSVACALGQIEIAYRFSRRMLPGREDLQKVAIAVSGLLPMGFAVSQGVGNEPLHALLAALTLLAVVALVQREGPLSWRDAALLGALWGLALLAKTSAALLAAPLAFALWLRIRRTPDAWPREVAAAALAGVCTLVVAGWYYARNWIALGTPFGLGTPAAGGALPADGFWWQEPGYRVLAQLTHFGTSLVRPFHAATHGVWDAYYATLWADGNLGAIVELASIPPWNYAPMLASTWLAIVPAALIALGFARALVAGRDRRDALESLAAIALATQLAAVLLLFVELPIYSQGKATYTLGLTPIFGVLAASGCRLLDRLPLVRTTAHALVAAWTVLVVCAYFVV